MSASATAARGPFVPLPLFKQIMNNRDTLNLIVSFLRFTHKGGGNALITAFKWTHPSTRASIPYTAKMCVSAMENFISHLLPAGPKDINSQHNIQRVRRACANVETWLANIDVNLKLRAEPEEAPFVWEDEYPREMKLWPFAKFEKYYAKYTIWRENTYKLKSIEQIQKHIIACSTAGQHQWPYGMYSDVMLVVAKLGQVVDSSRDDSFQKSFECLVKTAHSMSYKMAMVITQQKQILNRCLHRPRHICTRDLELNVMYIESQTNCAAWQFRDFMAVRPDVELLTRRVKASLLTIRRFKEACAADGTVFPPHVPLVQGPIFLPHM
jgi:hypothetical protein